MMPVGEICLYHDYEYYTGDRTTYRKHMRVGMYDYKVSPHWRD